MTQRAGDPVPAGSGVPDPVAGGAREDRPWLCRGDRPVSAGAIVRFKKGEVKEDIAREHFGRAERDGRFRVVLIGVAQEKTSAWRGWRDGGPDGDPHFEYRRHPIFSEQLLLLHSGSGVGTRVHQDDRVRAVAGVGVSERARVGEAPGRRTHRLVLLHALIRRTDENHTLRELIAGLIPGYNARQMTYDLRRLRGKGFIQRIPTPTATSWPARDTDWPSSSPRPPRGSSTPPSPSSTRDSRPRSPTAARSPEPGAPTNTNSPPGSPARPSHPEKMTQP